MKYDISTKLLTHSGETIPASREEGADDLTVKDMLELACLNPPAEDAKDGEKKHKIYRLLQKIHDADSVVDLSSDEVVQLKRFVGAISSVVVTGFVYDFLENPVTETPDHEE